MNKLLFCVFLSSFIMLIYGGVEEGAGILGAVCGISYIRTLVVTAWFVAILYLVVYKGLVGFFTAGTDDKKRQDAVKCFCCGVGLLALPTILQFLFPFLNLTACGISL